MKYSIYYVLVNLDINRYLTNDYYDGSDDYWSGNIKDAKLFLNEYDITNMLIQSEPDEDDFNPFWEVISKVRSYEIKKVLVK